MWDPESWADLTGSPDIAEIANVLVAPGARGAGAGADLVAHVVAEARRMPATVRSVLGRYPAAPTGRTRVAQLMTMLDEQVRATR